MKNSKRTLALSSAVLALSLAFPAVSFADAQTASEVRLLRQSNERNFDKLNDDKMVEISTKLGEINDTNSNGLEAIRAEVSKAGDYSRKDVAAAIINYEAEARLKEYELNEALRFEPAPGVQLALQAAIAVADAEVSKKAEELAKLAFQELMSEYWPSERKQEEQQVILNESGTLTTPKSPRQILFEKYVLGQEAADNLHSLNLGEVIRMNKTTNDLAKQFMAIVISPDKDIDKETAEKLSKYRGMSLGEFTALPLTDKIAIAEQEKVADAMIDAVNMSPSTNILSGILSRRILSAEDEEAGSSEAKTVMESIEKYANDRFQNKAWYGHIGKSSDTALLREIAHMLAYNGWMQMQAFKLQEQEASAMAILNANAARLYVVMKHFTDELSDENSEIRRAAAKAEADLNKAAESAARQAKEAAEAASE